MTITSFPFVPFILAFILSAHGFRKKSLSPDGALMAFLVGFWMLTGGTATFGIELIVFYLLGSRATKYGKERKAKLEEGYHEAGHRSGWQVLSNSVPALVASMWWNVLFAPKSFQAQLFGWWGDTAVNSSECIVDYGFWSRKLAFAVLGHFGCCLGDTLASELGILSVHDPILVTTLKRVPRGTNGGMSLGGTLASIIGGLIMGLTMGLCLMTQGCESPALFRCLILGTFSGGFGSFVDSLLGATVQETRYSVGKKMVVNEHYTKGGSTQRISGLNILSNNQVNFVSSLFTAVVVGWLA